MTSPASQPIADDLEDGEQPEGQGEQERGRRVLRAPGRLAAWWGSASSIDLGICLIFVLMAAWITRGLWPHPATSAIADNANDQALIEWFLAQGVLVWRGQFSFVTDRLNSPDGVNLMSNASHILHGVIMAPFTALFGAPVSFALLVALNLAGTAAAWYLLFVRCLNLRRFPAAVGGAFAGFAPGMISQSHSHLHMTAQWLVPLMVYLVIRLTRVSSARSAIVTGVGLGVTVFAQVMLGEEVLFLTATTLGLFSVVYAVRRWRWTTQVLPRFLAGGLVAAGVAAILLAYPLWVQFRGPQHTPNAAFQPMYFFADVASYPLFSPLSIAGTPEAGKLATSSAELNSYLGLPIILVVIGLLVWRWRAPTTPAIGVTSVIMVLFSFGPFITVNQHRIYWPSLYNKISHIPLVDGGLPTRYSLALIPLIAVLVAYGMNSALGSPGVARVVVPVAVIAAMVPTLPRTMDTTTRAPVPDFIASGAWRQCTPDGGVLVPVPLPTPQQPDLMRWPAAADDAFGIPEGFFIGPYAEDHKSSIGRYPAPTSQLLAKVARDGAVPQTDAGTRAQARADLTYWKADCVALAHVPNESALHSTLDQLLGPGTLVDDVWAWKINR